MDLRSPRQRALLARVLVADGSVVSVGRLVEDLWETDESGDHIQSLHTHVSRLRALLVRQIGQDARGLLVTRPPGYQLSVDAIQVDARRFERLAGDIRATGDLERVTSLSGQALSLWRGAALPEFDQLFARTEAARLEEVRLDVLGRRSDALLALGREEEAIAVLAPLVAEHPLREQLRDRLMLGLYRSGRQVEALAVYRDLRDRLSDELGMEPSAALRRLERDILRQAEELAGPCRSSVSVAARTDAVDGTFTDTSARLPAEVTSFVGRDEDVAGVAAALQRTRLVTLTGVGGVGKTRLGLRVARDVESGHRDGVRLCDCASVDDPALVVSAVATSLGVKPQGPADLEHAVIDLLRHLDVVVVLDGCEHVLDGAARLVDRVVQSCPTVRVLATSRRPLAVAGEQVWRVRPLPVDIDDCGTSAALALFSDRARAVDPGFAVTRDNRDATLELCRRLDGLPLAIELAAARARSMTPTDVLERLDQRFALLESGWRNAPQRHQTLEAVVAWSYTLLPELTRRLFERLAVFAGGFTLEAAEHICADADLAPAEIPLRLGELVDHSLVVVESGGRHARYRLLDTLRSYAENQLDDPAPWQRRHARYYDGLAAHAEAGIQGAQVADSVEVLDTELANLRAAHLWAMSTGDVDMALSLPTNLHHYALFRLRDEVFRWVEQALAMPAACGTAGHAAAVAVAGAGCAHRGDLDRASVHAHRARRETAATDDATRLRVLGVLCEIAIFRRRLPELEQWSEQLIGLGRSTGRRYDEAFGHLFRAFGAMFAGHLDTARAHVVMGSELADMIGNADLRASLQFLDGQIHLDGDPARAARSINAALATAEAVGNRFALGVAGASAAALQAEHGDARTSLQMFADVIDQWRRGGQWTHLWATLRKLLDLFVHLDAHEPAAVLCGVIEQAHTSEAAFGGEVEHRAMVIATVRGSVDTDVFDAARARGRTMRDDEAITWALAAIDDLLADTRHRAKEPTAPRGGDRGLRACLQDHVHRGLGGSTEPAESRLLEHVPDA